MKTAVLGATGLVGRIMVSCLAQREWVDDEPLLLCSGRSAGTELPFRDREVTCQDAAEADLSDVRVALFSAGVEASQRYAPLFRDVGAWVVDNSAAYRMDPDVPLVVPEINAILVPTLDPTSAEGVGIIANPNCTTIQIALALAPLQNAFGLREVHVTTLQSLSGAGQRALETFQRELSGEGAGPDRLEESPFPQPVAFNVLPAIGKPQPDGSFAEETKVVRELRKILDLAELPVTCTAIRVPVIVGHGAAVRVVLEQSADPRAAAAAMASWPGLEVQTDPHAYLTPQQVCGQTEVHVGRLRQQEGSEDSLLFWVVADNLLKGAAWNAVQIADLLIAPRAKEAGS